VNYAKPVITREPVSQKALRFGNISMVCEAASSSDSMLTTSWKKDNEVYISYASRSLTYPVFLPVEMFDLCIFSAKNVTLGLVFALAMHYRVQLRVGNQLSGKHRYLELSQN